MPGKSPGPSIKNPKVYEALKEEGYSKESAAKISNSQKKKSENNKKPAGQGRRRGGPSASGPTNAPKKRAKTKKK